MRAIFSTLRFRITLLNILVFGGALLVFNATLYWIYVRDQESEFDKFLYNRAIGITRSIAIDFQGQLEINQALIAESGRLFPFESGNEYIQMRSPQGRVVARTRNLGATEIPFDPKLLALMREGKYAFLTLESETDPFWGEGRLRVLCMPVFAQGRVQIILQLGVSTHALDMALARLRTVLFWVGLPLTLLLTGAGGWWLVGRAFRPINRIIRAAQRLDAVRFEERLPVPEAEDELRRLSLTLNEMLDRLGRAFHSQQRFVADASHELKTPLTILQGELDVLRQQPRSVAEYQTFLASASEELRRLSRIIQNLLLLARADSGRPLQLASGVRLDEVVLEAVERLQSFALGAQVRLQIKIGESGGDEKTWLLVRGDEGLLGSLFFNLIHNAIKFSAAGQAVEVRLEPVEEGVSVSVRDFGTGIRSGDLEHIFERFHRAENPVLREMKGTGLGLAIAHWIASAHGAKIFVESKPAEGSLFRVIFPIEER